MLTTISDQQAQAICGGAPVSYVDLAANNTFPVPGQVGNGTIGNSFTASGTPDNFGQFNKYSTNAAVDLLGLKNKGQLNQLSPGLTGSQVKATNPSNF